MSDGNWPDPERLGQPEDVSLCSDYWLARGSVDLSPRRYTWVPAHDVVQGLWMPNEALSGEQTQYTAQEAAQRFTFCGPVEQ